MFAASALSLLWTFPLVAQEPESAGGPRQASELEERRKALEGWAVEPVAIEAAPFLLHVDRHDGSFFLEDYRGGVKWFSSWGRRGFASVRLADGRELPVDRLEALHAQEKKIRFRGASSAGELPDLRFEFELPPSGNLLTLRFEVPAASQGRIASVRLLADALWLTDADGGGVAVPRGIGEWYDAVGESDADVRLTGLAPFTASPEEAYNIPLLAFLKGEAALLLYWESPSAVVEVRRGRPEDERFPGSTGLFVSIEFCGAEGAVHLAPLGRHQLELVDAARTYRQLAAERVEPASLRYKTGLRADLVPSPRALLGAVFFRPTILESPQPPLASGRLRYSFAEIGQIAEHWKRTLEIGDAAFVLDGWLGVGSGDRAGFLKPAVECGGEKGLQECAARLRKVGYLLGLALERDQLIRSGERTRPFGARAWEAALKGARADEGLPALQALCAPQMVVIRASRERTAGDRRAALLENGVSEARDDLGSYVVETFGLYGTGPGSEGDAKTAVFLEGPLSPKLRQPTSRGVYPLFPAVYGHCARIAVARDDGLAADDAAGFLAHLIYGEAPSYSLPPHLYFKERGEKTGDGPEWCFARAEGWAAGKDLLPLDVFIKNTYEVCSHVAVLRARNPMLSHRFLSADGRVQETYFGLDLRIVVNYGSEPYDDKDSECLLPQYGFVVRHPFFYAFHALRANGLEYERPALFTVRSLGSKMYLRAEKTRIYHGFGPAEINLGGRTFTVEREAVVRIW